MGGGGVRVDVNEEFKKKLFFWGGGGSESGGGVGRFERRSEVF